MAIYNRIRFFFGSALSDNSRLRILSMTNNPKLDQLPVRLFHEDASQLDISLQDNAFTTLDAAQLPIDRLVRLRLAGNPFVCNCSLAWLWRLIDAAASSPRSSSVLENGPNPLTSAQLVSDADTEALDTDDRAWAEAFVRVSTRWSWTPHRRPSPMDDKLVVEDMHRITCDLVLSADGKSRGRKRFIDLQEAQIQCSTSILLTMAVLVLILLAVLTCLFVWLCRKRHLERLLAKHETDRPIDPWPMDHIEKFEIARDMHGLEYEIRQLDFQNRQLPPINVPQQLQHQFSPHRNWNTPTMRSSNHYSSSQPPTNNHEYQEPILLTIPDVPPPLPPRPTLPRVHKYETPTAPTSSQRDSPTTVATTMGRFQRGGAASSLSPASQSKYSRTLQSGPSSGAQFSPRRTAAFHRDDYQDQEDHDGDDESNGLEDES